MSYSYQGNDYPQTQIPVTYYNEPQKRKTNSGFLGTVVGGTAIGAATSGGIAAFQNPYIDKNGEAKDAFVKKVHAETLKNADEETKTFAQQRQNIIEKIGNAKNAEETAKILKENDRFTKGAIAIDENTFYKSINENNFKEIGNDIKKHAINSMGVEEKFHKLNIQNSWNKDAKKFVKPELLDETYFKNIESASSGMKLQNIGKSALRGAGIGLGVALVLGGLLKFLQSRNQ